MKQIEIIQDDIDRAEESDTDPIHEALKRLGYENIVSGYAVIIADKDGMEHGFYPGPGYASYCLHWDVHSEAEPAIIDFERHDSTPI
jgi:hypothetical protein